MGDQKRSMRPMIQAMSTYTEMPPSIRAAIATPCRTYAIKFVLVCLAYHADKATGRPSIETICRETELERNVVVSALIEIDAMGRPT